MLLCRNVWQKLVPLTHRGAAALLRNASVRQMSSSSVPGSSGEALPYYLLVAVSLTGGVFYAYRTVSRDRARSNERHEYINTQLKPAFEDYESKSDKAEASAVSETIEEAVEAAIEETAAEEVTEQEAAPTATQEQEQAEDEAASAPTEQEQEPAPSTEAASKQVEPGNVEPVGETLEETSPVLEASSDITKELALAAEDWSDSELTARKPEETVESVPAAQVYITDQYRPEDKEQYVTSLYNQDERSVNECSALPIEMFFCSSVRLLLEKIKDLQTSPKSSYTSIIIPDIQQYRDPEEIPCLAMKPPDSAHLLFCRVSQFISNVS